MLGRDLCLGDEGLPDSVPSGWRLEMAPDLEALVVAGYVFADEYPVPARPGPRVKTNDAELVALAVC